VVAIVRGTVSATRDLYVDRVGFRVLTVDVAETLRGEPGGQITVLEDGAVVPYADVAAQLAEKQGAPARTDTDGYIDFRFMGARHSEVGDEVVLFLGVNPNVGTPIDTQYFIVSSVHGRFTLDTTTNTFQRGGAEGAAGRLHEVSGSRNPEKRGQHALIPIAAIQPSVVCTYAPPTGHGPPTEPEVQLQFLSERWWN
jgi:hypothetical protein